ncbi:uncharacterized protein PV07_08688 [Cladophialophora immunda]|uniref:DUF427 domain-containing protein n=1 Tax=Cladophialophora immunda TaxID=569365 RepID=A0A0D2AKP6_9EURO|nr:uncharacterized protein PV07_08688 [Cladophialophora immunda]KIW25522.1 hypothetical protein PV07_08688 [Cladophialophora immunda]
MSANEAASLIAFTVERDFINGKRANRPGHAALATAKSLCSRITFLGLVSMKPQTQYTPVTKMPTATARVGDKVIASSSSYQTVEGNVYFPLSTLADPSMLASPTTHSPCPSTGKVNY